MEITRRPSWWDSNKIETHSERHRHIHSSTQFSNCRLYHTPKADNQWDRVSVVSQSQKTDHHRVSFFFRLYIIIVARCRLLPTSRRTHERETDRERNESEKTTQSVTFLLPWMWSLLMCLTSSSCDANSSVHPSQWLPMDFIERFKENERGESERNQDMRSKIKPNASKRKRERGKSKRLIKIDDRHGRLVISSF